MTMTQDKATGSGTIADHPTVPEPATRFEQGPASRIETTYRRRKAHFTGARYLVSAAPKAQGIPTRVRTLLLEEGYREQASEALWLAESALAAEAETLPE